jgi:hypothetical protein
MVQYVGVQYRKNFGAYRHTVENTTTTQPTSNQKEMSTLSPNAPLIERITQLLEEVRQEKNRNHAEMQRAKLAYDRSRVKFKAASKRVHELTATKRQLKMSLADAERIVIDTIRGLERQSGQQQHLVVKMEEYKPRREVRKLSFVTPGLLAEFGTEPYKPEIYWSATDTDPEAEAIQLYKLPDNFTKALKRVRVVWQTKLRPVAPSDSGVKE